jgi:hypothetical protein
LSRFDRTMPLSAAQTLLEQLRDLRRRDEEMDVESTAARVRWLDAVEKLIATIRAWLQAAATEGLVKIDAAVVKVDDDLGAYDAPALKLGFPGARVVWVRPVGTLRVGAQGIVDVVHGSSRALVVLNRNGVWKLRGPAPTATLVPLDEDTFCGALVELIQ